MYQKVLVPLDGSELAECTLPQVTNLARGGNIGEVVLLRVIKVNMPHDYRGVGLQSEAYRLHRTDRARKYLESIQSRLHSEGINVQIALIESESPERAIADYARENAVDLLIIASHGYTGMKKLVFGSVALKILQLAPMPVLLIKPEYCSLPEKAA